MSGLGFSLRRDRGAASNPIVSGSYAAAGVVGSGPWVVSIVSMALIGWGCPGGRDAGEISTFLATVTHLMACSMILVGGIQLLVARFCADRVYEGKLAVVAPNVFGALLLTTAVSCAVGTGLLALPTTAPYAYRALCVAAFVVLSNLWVVSAVLSAFREYAAVLWTYVFGYAFVAAAALGLARFGLAGLMTAFCLGHGAMLFAMLTFLGRRVPPPIGLLFGFLDRRQAFFDLSAVGFLFNLGVWADKFVFWWHPVTSSRLLGPIRASIVYDVPVSIAYLSIIPAMAVFFVRMQTDFGPQYERFFRDVREGQTLRSLERQRDALVEAARAGVHDMLRVEALVVAALLLVAPAVLRWLHIPKLYAPLFRVDVVGVGCQVVLLGILTLLFYLDHRRAVLLVVSTFAVANASLSLLSIRLGVRFYGYGFALSTAIAALLALALVSRRFDRLEFATFVRR